MQTQEDKSPEPTPRDLRIGVVDTKVWAVGHLCPCRTTATKGPWRSGHLVKSYGVARTTRRAKPDDFFCQIWRSDAWGKRIRSGDDMRWQHKIGLGPQIGSSAFFFLPKFSLIVYTKHHPEGCLLGGLSTESSFYSSFRLWCRTRVEAGLCPTQECCLTSSVHSSNFSRYIIFSKLLYSSNHKAIMELHPVNKHGHGYQTCMVSLGKYI